MLGKADIHLRLGLLEYIYQMLVRDFWHGHEVFLPNIDEVILGTDIMNAYGFVVNLRENVLRLSLIHI